MTGSRSSPSHLFRKEDDLFLHVTNVQLLSDYALRLVFSDGSVREADLKGELHGEVFEPLREPAVFAGVFVNLETGTIEWPNGADFAPEFLASIGKLVGPMEPEPMKVA